MMPGWWAVQDQATTATARIYTIHTSSIRSPLGQWIVPKKHPRSVQATRGGSSAIVFTAWNYSRKSRPAFFFTSHGPTSPASLAFLDRELFSQTFEHDGPMVRDNGGESLPPVFPRLVWISYNVTSHTTTVAPTSVHYCYCTALVKARGVHFVNGPFGRLARRTSRCVTPRHFFSSARKGNVRFCVYPKARPCYRKASLYDHGDEKDERIDTIWLV